MRRGLCSGTMSVRLSVRLSVCLSQLSTAAAFRAAGLQLWARRAEISIDSGGRTVPHSSTAHSSKCGQCHAVSWRMKLNTDWSRFLRRCRSMWWVDHVCRLGPVTRNTSCTLRLQNELVHTASTPPTLCLPIVHNRSYWFRFRIFNLRSVLWHCRLGVRKNIRPVKMSDEVLAWLSVWSEVQIVCIWSSWCHCHPKIPSSLAWFKSILVSPFWYRITEVVLEKRPLNGCSRSSSNKRQKTRSDMSQRLGLLRL